MLLNMINSPTWQVCDVFSHTASQSMSFFNLVVNVRISVPTIFHALPVLFHDAMICKTVLEPWISPCEALIVSEIYANSTEFFVLISIWSLCWIWLIFFHMESNIFYTYDHLWKLIKFSDSEKDSSSCSLSG